MGGLYQGQRGGSQSQAHPDTPLLQVIAPLLRVLSVLHNTHGIVHRDIKPENIFLSDNGEGRHYLHSSGECPHL